MHSFGGRVHLQWQGDVATVNGDLSKFQGEKASRKIRVTDARTFAKAIIAITHRSDADTCVSTTSQGASMYWQCDAEPAQTTHFRADLCGDSSS